MLFQDKKHDRTNSGPAGPSYSLKGLSVVIGEKGPILGPDWSSAGPTLPILNDLNRQESENCFGPEKVQFRSSKIIHKLSHY